MSYGQKTMGSSLGSDKLEFKILPKEAATSQSQLISAMKNARAAPVASEFSQQNISPDHLSVTSAL